MIADFFETKVGAAIALSLAFILYALGRGMVWFVFLNFLWNAFHV